MTSEMANHTTSGMSAMAVSRWAHQCPTPSLAEPRPRARARGVLRSSMRAALDQPEADDPRQGRGEKRDDDDGPAAAIGVLELEAVGRVPEQVPDAVAEMIEGAEQPAAQDDADGDRGVEALEQRIGARASRRVDHPGREIERPDSERDAGRAMQDRQDRRELPLVDLKMGRQRPVGRPIGDAHRARPLFAYVGMFLARGRPKSTKLGHARALSPRFCSEIRLATTMPLIEALRGNAFPIRWNRRAGST